MCISIWPNYRKYQETFLTVNHETSLLTDNLIQLISLDQIKVQKYNVRRHDIDVGIEDLAVNIKANGLLQPITTYFNSEKQSYVILAGQRRLNAHHHLNEQYPEEGFDRIKCIVIDEPESDNKKISLSLAENITQLPMTNSDLVKAVTDLYNIYHDYDIVQEEFGLTKYMVDKFVKLARLPDRIKTAVNEGEISPNTRTAENSALKAVDALNYVKGGNVPVDSVLQLAREHAKGEIDAGDLVSEAGRGGTIEDIKSRAKKKPKSKIEINLSTDIAEKLQKVADDSGETTQSRATSYVVNGINRDYSDLNS